MRAVGWSQRSDSVQGSNVRWTRRVQPDAAYGSDLRAGVPEEHRETTE